MDSLEEYGMMVNGRLLGVSLATLTVGLWFLTANGTAADDSGLKGQVNKIADALAKKDNAAAEKEAKAVAAKAEIEDVMHLFSKKTPKGGGFGVGTQPNSGIELKINELGRRPIAKDKLAKESPDLIRMAYQAAAIGDIAHAKPPEKDEGKKKKSDWLKWSGEMKDSAVKLADTIKGKDPMAIKTAATKLSASCTACHEVFRD
jgi:hypothetical protein